jgi:hypothetical protein
MLQRDDCFRRACSPTPDGRHPWQLAPFGPQEPWTKADAVAILVSRPAAGEADATLEGSGTGSAKTSICYTGWNQEAKRPAIRIMDEAGSEPREVHLQWPRGLDTREHHSYTLYGCDGDGGLVFAVGGKSLVCCSEHSSMMERWRLSHTLMPRMMRYRISHVTGITGQVALGVE